MEWIRHTAVAVLRCSIGSSIRKHHERPPDPRSNTRRAHGARPRVLHRRCLGEARCRDLKRAPGTGSARRAAEACRPPGTAYGYVLRLSALRHNSDLSWIGLNLGATLWLRFFVWLIVWICRRFCGLSPVASFIEMNRVEKRIHARLSFFCHGRYLHTAGSMYDSSATFGVLPR